MTLHSGGYVLEPGASVEELDMGGGTVLSLRVTGEQSNGALTVFHGASLIRSPAALVLAAGS